MTLYGKEFTLNENAIDTASIEYVPCEGAIIPFKIDNIDGLREQLYQCGFSDPRRKRVIDTVFLYLTDGRLECGMFVKYTTKGLHNAFVSGFRCDAEEMICLWNLCMVH